MKNNFKNIHCTFSITLALTHARARFLYNLIFSANRKHSFTPDSARVYALGATKTFHVVTVIIKKFSHLLKTYFGRSSCLYRSKHRYCTSFCIYNNSTVQWFCYDSLLIHRLRAQEIIV